MLKEKKPVFLINDEGLALRFNTLLSKNLGIETELEDYGFSKLISVSRKDYQNALKEGFIIANLNNYNLCWVNAYGELRTIGYVSVMYCELPKTREGNLLWEIQDVPNCCPADILEYIQKLKAFLGGYSIKIKYNSTDNAIEFLINCSLGNHEQIKQQCDIFNRMIKNSPFVRTTFLEKDGTLINNKRENTKEESNLESYFNKSMFMDGLLRPEGSNIAPKTDNDQDHTTGYKYSFRKYGVRNFNSTTFDIDNITKSIQGTFLVFEEKEYSHYWNNEKERQTNCNPKMPFTMLDNGDFVSKIAIQDEDTIEVNTSVNIIRNIVGCNFDGKSVRDGLFSGLPHEDCRRNFEFKEYYKKISNGTRLLHYSDSSDFFEVYDLPNGWTIEDGISKLGNPKVFDDIDFDDQDKDLNEINNVLESPAKKESTQFIKKNNNSK